MHDQEIDQNAISQGDAERWGSFAFDQKLRITEGRAKLEGSLDRPVPEALADLLDADAHHILASVAKRLWQDEGDTCMVALKEGPMLELFVTRQGEWFKAFYRIAPQHMPNGDRLSIFYHHFITSPMAICFTDSKGCIVDANKAFLDLYGYRIEEVRGQTPRVIKSGRQSPEVYAELWANISDPERGHWTGEVINRKRSGEEVTALLSIVAVRKPDGKLIGFIASTLDITKRKLMEEELRTRNEELEGLLRLKSELMAITSHDLKAPLNAMISYAALLKENFDDYSRDKSLQFIDRIITSGTRLTEFINELLDLRKIEGGRLVLQPRRLHLEGILRNVAETGKAVGMRLGVEVTLVIEGNPGPLWGDPMKMEQVFHNLVSNALKFSPTGTTVSVRFWQVEEGHFAVAVSDQGPGIPHDSIPHIFDPYYQVKQKGSIPKRIYGVGLGLSIVKSIVDMHGGQVCIENNPATGCCFTVTLPAMKAPFSINECAALVVDPSDAIFQYVVEPLRRKAVDCYTVRTPAEAQRVFALERPEFLFLSAQACQAEEFAPVLEKCAQAQWSPAFIGIIEGSCADDMPGLEVQLFPPVMDMEIYGAMQDLLASRKQKAG